MTSDLGLEWLTSTDLLGLGFCVVLTLLSMKMKSYPFVALAAIAWMAVGLQITLSSQSPMLLLLTFSIAAAQVFWGLKYKGW